MRGAIKAQSCCVLGAVPVGPHPAAEAFELCCGTMSQMSQLTSRKMSGRLKDQSNTHMSWILGMVPFTSPTKNSLL